MLSNSIASQRHKKRVESVLIEISRILRDISANEIAFLSNNKGFKKIVFEDSTLDSELYIVPGSDESVIISGLISMGLIIPSTPSIDGISAYQFSPLVAKMLAVLNDG